MGSGFVLSALASTEAWESISGTNAEIYHDVVDFGDVYIWHQLISHLAQMTDFACFLMFTCFIVLFAVLVLLKIFKVRLSR